MEEVCTAISFLLRSSMNTTGSTMVHQMPPLVGAFIRTRKRTRPRMDWMKAKTQKAPRHRRCASDRKSRSWCAPSAGSCRPWGDSVKRAISPCGGNGEPLSEAFDCENSESDRAAGCPAPDHTARSPEIRWKNSKCLPQTERRHR